MFTRLFAPAVVVLCAGLAMAQSTTNTQPTKNQTPPSKLEPVKKDGAQPQQKEKVEPTLKVGHKAPAINVERWLKGDAVTGFEKGRVYVVEFWATWCGPCMKSIPHLTEVAKKHKELTIIGVTSSERKDKDGTDNRLTKLEEWMKTKGKDMGYNVGYEGEYKMWKDWMVAAGRNGIPSAFIVNAEGVISWIGNPLAKDFDEAVESALTSTTSAKKPVDKNTDKLTDKTPKKNEKK